MRKKRGYWTKERVFEESKKYQTSTEFKKGCKAAYQAAQRNGLLKEMTWFVSPQKPNGYWTKERIFEEAKKYKTRTEFQKGNPTAYGKAHINDWLKEMTWFIYKDRKPNGYWNNKERVFAEARKYETKREFEKGCTTAYQVAHKKGWIDEMTWFIEGRIKLLSQKNDSVYRYFFKETNSIYVGRTLMTRQNERDNEHMFDKDDTVYKYAKKNGFAVPPMEIIEENITIKEGLEREDYWKNYYKERGYNVLNVAKTGKHSGSLGTIGFNKWTRQRVFEEARKYKTRTEFKKGCRGAYTAACKNKWISEMTWFVSSQKPNGYWNNKERVFEEARKYRNRTEFQKGSVGAYQKALKNGWLDELFPKYKIAS